MAELPVSERQKLALRDGLNLSPPPTETVVKGTVDSDTITQAPLGYGPEVPEGMLDEVDLINWLRSEIQFCEGERGEIVDNFAHWEEVYKAPLSDEPKDFPLKNSSNIPIPVVKEQVNTVASSLLQTILTPRPRFMMKGFAPEWEPFKDVLEDFLDLAADRDLGFSNKMENWILEGVKLGTSVMEVSHEAIYCRDYELNADNSQYEGTKYRKRVGPTLWNVPLQDFYIRVSEQNIQEAPWVAKRTRLTYQQLKERVYSGKFREAPTIKLIRTQVDLDEGEVIDKLEELQNFEPVYNQLYTVFEVWHSWNLNDGDDLETELLTYYAHGVYEPLACRFQPYWHRKRPFVHFVYFPVEHRFYGEGLPEQLEGLQEEIKTTHNQRIDASTLANAKVIITRKLLGGLKPGDPLYAGKVIQVDDPLRDVREFSLGDPSPMTVESEGITRQYIERLSGVSEAQLRGGFPVTRTTASAQSMLLEERKQRFDQVVRKMREGVGMVGSLTLHMYFQYGAGEKPFLWMGQEKGEILTGIFNLPKRASDVGIGLEASAPTSQLNKETQRQNSLALFNLLVQSYEKILPLAAQLAPKDTPEVVSAMVSAAKKFLFQTLEEFDQSNPQDILAGFTVLERVLPAPEDLGGLAANEATAQTAQVLDQLSRLEDLLRRTPRGTEGGGRKIPSIEDIRGLLGPQGVSGFGGPLSPTSYQLGPNGRGSR